MFKLLFALPELCRLTLLRLASRPLLTLLSLFGMVLAVGLLTSAAFFSQAVDRVILTQELERLTAQTGRPPFATRIYFLPSSRFPVGVTNAELLGRDLAATLSGEVGLPVARQGLTIDSGGQLLFPPPGDTRYANDGTHLMTVNLAYVAGVADQMAIEAGDPLADQPPALPGRLDVWLHVDLAAELGAGVGEQFQVAPNRRQPLQMVYVRGLWRAKDPTDPFWFSNPDSAFRTSLLVTRDTYLNAVEPFLAAKAGFIAWQITLDEGRVNPAYARQYATGLERAMAVINQYLPRAEMDVSPLQPLEQFVRRQATLTTTLLGFNLPSLLFLFYFLLLIGLIIVRWQARETALLASRGLGGGVVLSLTLLEAVLLLLVGLPLGLGLGMLLARWMGFAASFLQFTDRPPLPVTWQGINFPLVGLALAIALLARLLPLLGDARQSVVSQSHNAGRPLRPPFWLRAYLDVILILPTAYALDQLAKRGTLALRAGAPPELLFQDPLLIIVPALFVLTAALLAMRLFPWLMRLLDLVAGHTRWLALHLALRQLGRSSQHYLNPLLLVIVALGMGSYTRSLAASLDQWLTDQIYYRVGADLTLRPLPPPNSEGEEPPPAALFIPPPADFLELPGVQAATRVGNYPARLLLPQREWNARMIAIDRVDFDRVAWFRRDFAPAALGALMNALALAPENVLVNPAFLATTGLQANEEFRMRVSLADEYPFFGTFRIAGVYDYFPTVMPDEPTVIGNLEHLFTEAGADFGHDIWLRTAPGTVGKRVFAAVEGLGITVGSPRDTQTLLAVEQAKMERVGIFGTLSVGFVAATLMAILALLVHSDASLQERLYQFGVLRAMGLRRRQVLGQVALEYLVLTAYGAVVGAAIGLGTAELFAPFFRIPSGVGAPPPPLIPLIQPEVTVQFAVLFAGLMILAELGTLAYALHRRHFEAIRTGHQA